MVVQSCVDLADLVGLVASDGFAACFFCSRRSVSLVYVLLRGERLVSGILSVSLDRAVPVNDKSCDYIGAVDVL